MARILTILLTLLITCAAQATTTKHRSLVNFEKDRSELTAEARAELQVFLAQVELKGDYILTVHGHTDSDGSVAYNEALSLDRANTVRQFLIDHGADPKLVSIDRSGERAPMASNADNRGMALNRRVEVSFERHHYTDTEELRNALMEGTVQHFTIDPTKDQVVQGTTGTQLKIRAGSLVDARGRPVQGEVDLELTEALGLQSILAHQLSTRSGSTLLETGGMLKVSATDASGAELRITAASPMEISIPADVQEEGMELFLSDDGSDWTSTTQPITTTIVTTWVEPAYPMPRRIPFRFPVYKEDQAGRPMKPMDPLAPKAPAEPRRESYQAHRPWWSFLFPQRAQAAADARYALALKEHERKMERYNKKVVRYEVEHASYADRLAAYEVRKAEWDAQKNAEYEAWYNDVNLPARARYTELMAPLRAEQDSLVADWRAVREASMEQYVLRSDSMGTAELGGLNAYVFTTARMGWINCDRFYRVPEEQKRSVVAQGCNSPDAQVFVVFTQMRSMMMLGRDGSGQYISAPVPSREPAMLFAYAVIDGQAHVSMEPIGPDGRPEVRLEPSSFAEIGQLLKELGSQPG
ncbi:MAG: OmpA family protein [Flavobacteriales bacterium]